MRPLIEGYAPENVVAWRRGEPLTARAALTAARGLAQTLPAARYVANLCDDLDTFIVVALAALVSGRTLILPAAKLPRALADLRAAYPESVCVADRASEIADAPIVADSFIDRAMREPGVDANASPTIAADHRAAILFTSGSTGAPQPHAKTWGSLTDGALALMRSIASPPPGAAIVGTVPPQHMFGLETTLMLPLQSGTPVIAARPAFAADLRDAVARASTLAPAGVWLMTTPLQLRAFHRELPSLAGIDRIIASTMPLDVELARAIERDWNTPVHEIYGCTEGGILAVRRTARNHTWRPAAGVVFDIAADGRAQASGGHLEDPLPLSDRLRKTDDDGAFELVGRDSDLVKVAGKRASLSGLARELCAISGVQDGAVFMPSDHATRTAALVVAPGLSEATIRRELALRVDAAFLPRPLRIVDALPRNAAGKLPLDALRRALAPTMSPPRTLTARLRFAADHPSLPGHFPGRPIVPGVMLLASVEDVLHNAGLRVVGCAHAKFFAPVPPGEALAVRVDVGEDADARFEITAAGTTVAAGVLRCAGAAA